MIQRITGKPIPACMMVSCSSTRDGQLSAATVYLLEMGPLGAPVISLKRTSDIDLGSGQGRLHCNPSTGELGEGEAQEVKAT